MVFSKVAGAGLFAIAAISLRFTAIAASSAGWKSETLTLSKAG